MRPLMRCIAIACFVVGIILLFVGAQDARIETGMLLTGLALWCASGLPWIA